ncbi:hypothetical protein JWJ90_07560 [Desulfobulbus rhabdoformis]|uniref:hypothetical protein n=1 Tax=Desulfobulbus rhabdoformis TaxID=34032 RepID=UPI00196493DD|nr:hypothetical protein [Desulfobulbus rhabdoformis]MBM9614143.1 hypothetical protein [Desulfobulbus rhabdoformis]
MKRILVLIVACSLLVSIAFAAPPLPSTWQGQANGNIHGVAFHQPMVLELKQPLAYENNPLHLFLGTTTDDQVGGLYLVSAAKFSGGGSGYVYDKNPSGIGIYKKRIVPHSYDTPSPGTALAQYLSITIQGDTVTAILSNTNSKLAAAANSFTGPNVSGLEASAVMRSVLQSMGTTEMFLLQKGAQLRLQFQGNRVDGYLQGYGRSVLNTSSDVGYSCRFQLHRVK